MQLRNKIVIIFVPLALIAVTINSVYRDITENNYKCKTVDMAIKGVVISKVGRSYYMKAKVDNIRDRFSFNIAKKKYKKGYPEYYSYEIGDSIIKAANSKEITVKKGDSIAIYILDCDN